MFQAKSYYRGKFNFRHRAYLLRAEKRRASAIFDRSCSKLSNRNEGCASTISASIESNRFLSRNPDAKHWNATTVFFSLFAFILCYIGLPVTFANVLRTTKESSQLIERLTRHGSIILRHRALHLPARGTNIKTEIHEILIFRSHFIILDRYLGEEQVGEFISSNTLRILVNVWWRDQSAASNLYDNCHKETTFICIYLWRLCVFVAI